MDSLPPYARLLGIDRMSSPDGDTIWRMPFGDVVLGRPGYLHGGAIAGLLEFAAFGAINEALGAEKKVTVKPINVTVQFMRGGTARDTFAAGTVTRLGNRVAVVEARAWQEDKSTLIASAQMNVRLRRDG